MGYIAILKPCAAFLEKFLKFTLNYKAIIKDTPGINFIISSLFLHLAMAVVSSPTRFVLPFDNSVKNIVYLCVPCIYCLGQSEGYRCSLRTCFHDILESIWKDKVPKIINNSN